MDAFDNHAALELSEYTAHGEHCATGSRRAVDLLLMQIEAAALLAQVSHKRDDVMQRAAQAINAGRLSRPLAPLMA